MPFASRLRPLRRGSAQSRSVPASRSPLWFEQLEERFVPSIIFNNTTPTTVSDNGGPVISQVHVELIFWGNGWNNSAGTALRTQVETAVDSLTSGPLLSALSEYRPDIGPGMRVGTVTITSSNPASVFSNGDVASMVTTNINNHTLPDPASDSQLLYMVIPQNGSTAGALGGEHSFVTLGATRVHFGWVYNPNNSFDSITYFFSHEMVEAVSDPEGSAIQVNPRNASSWNEIDDGEAQLYSYRLNGYLVNSWFSKANHGFLVPTGQSQDFFIASSTSRTLTINGDQLSDPDDTITIDQQNSGYKITINGEVIQFDATDFFTSGPSISSIVINTGTGNDTVNIEHALAGHPVTINLGDGTDTVNLSPTAQNLTNVAGAVTINGGSGTDTLNLYDQGVKSNQNYTLTSSSLTRNGLGSLTYHNLAAVVLTTTNGNDTVTMQTTAANTAVTITGGIGNNTLVGPASDTSWAITGSNSGSVSSASLPGGVSFSGIANLTGGAANNTFAFSDGGSLSGSLKGGKTGTLDYSATSGDVSINLANNTATGLGGSFSSIQNLTGGSGSNTLTGPNSATVWQLTGQGSGTVNGTLSFTGFQNLLGGSGTNSFVFSDGASVAGNLDGGGGGTLDYSAYSTSVLVDLQTSTATGVGGTLANIQNVLGGTGGGAGSYNILVGNGGNTLTGGNGRRNLLIAGASASTLIAGDDDDILIGGTTAYDMDLASLMAIMDYWSGSSDDYGTRVGNLLSGNGVPLLDPTMVTSNGGGNTLTGGMGVNLYYGNAADSTDFDPSTGAQFVFV